MPSTVASHPVKEIKEEICSPAQTVDRKDVDTKSPERPGYPLVCQDFGDLSTLEFCRTVKSSCYCSDTVVTPSTDKKHALSLVAVGQVAYTDTFANDIQTSYTLELLKTNSPLEKNRLTGWCEALMKESRNRSFLYRTDGYIQYLPWEDESVKFNRKELTDQDFGTWTLDSFNAAQPGDIVMVTFYIQVYVHHSSRREGIRFIMDSITRLATA